MPLYYADPAKVDSSPIFFVIKQGNLIIAELILDKGGQSLTYIRNSLGFTPVTYASSLNQHDILNHLSLRGFDLNQEDPQGITPLARYVLFSNFDQAKRLLSRGANVDYANREGKTAIVMAVQQMRLDAAKFLVSKGADPHIQDLTG